MNAYYENGLSKAFLFIAFALIVLGTRLNIIDALAIYMPYWDDWNTGTLVHKYVTGNLTFNDITFEANEHRQVFGRILALLMFELNHRQWDPVVMMIANSIIWTISGLFLVHIAIANYRSINPTPIILLILILWCYPISLVNTLWGTQSHIYFMTLFSILGCWYTTYPPFSSKWFIGVSSLFAGGLTLAGGSFIGVSVAVVFLIYAWADTKQRHDHIYTALAAILAAIFGVFLIVIQERSGVNVSRVEMLDLLSTVTKTMSWPVRTQVWPWLIFAIPIIVLVKNLLKNNTTNTKLTLFILSVYGFIFIIAFAIAIARPSGGSGPAKRYADFIALAFVVSTFALLLIQSKPYRLPKIPNQLLIVSWLILIVIAIPYRLEVLQHTLHDRADIIPNQIKNIREYINSNNRQWLMGKSFRHVPHPYPSLLGTDINKFLVSNVLPYQLQRPTRLSYHEEESDSQAFVYHGIYAATTNKFGGNLYGEAVIGSYNKPIDGNRSTGKFVSNIFNLNRNFAMIPITGYTGFPNMSLKLVNEATKQEILVKPAVRSSEFAESWREVLVKAPQGDYRVIAEDYNQTLWFGFASPRSVGRLSYWVQTYIEKANWLWFFGLSLFFLLYRQSLVKSVRPSNLW